MSELGELLKSFQDHARCAHPGPQRQANAVWRELKNLLTAEEMGKLGTAWGHCHEDSCSPAELDRVCCEIREQRGIS